MGGRSSEHTISLKSGAAVANHFQDDLYDVTYLSIGKDGKWCVHDTFPSLEDVSSVCSEALISEKVLKKLQNSDLLFPVLHGPYGEDGTIQGFFEMLNKPYVGCDCRSAAVAMDKVMTKIVCESIGVKTSPYRYYFKYEWSSSKKTICSEIIQNFTFPVFVKAVHLGSAIGVFKVDDNVLLEEIIDEVFEYDDKVVIEQEVRGREIEFAVLGNENPIVFPPGEVLSNGEVYTYDAKYGLDGFSASPKADLTEAQIVLGKKLAYQCYKAIGCEGMARIDFFLDANGDYWLNEINPIPGFTSISLYPKICMENGLTFSEILNRLVVLSMHRHRKKNSEIKNA